MEGTQITGGNFFSETSRSEPAHAVKPSCLTTSFMNPDDVVGDRSLTQAEKREILAAWASDVRAVPDAPALRLLDNGAIVRIDDILRALRSLDVGEDAQQAKSYARRPFMDRRVRFPSRLKLVLRRNWSDDDDDPPPCPAMIARLPPSGPLSGGEAIDASLPVAA